jgi:hypothetical protein
VNFKCLGILFLLTFSHLSCNPLSPDGLDGKSRFSPQYLPGLDSETQGTTLSVQYSLLTTSASTVILGSSAVITLQLKDQNGSPYTSAQNVSFGLRGGTGLGSFSIPVKVSDSIYTSSFTALSLGTPVSIYAIVDGQELTISSTPIEVVSTNPIVTSINSLSSSGTYFVGSTIPIQVVFNRTVYVTGTPQILLKTGPTSTRTVDYTSGSGSSTLVFNYMTGNTDTSTGLDINPTSTLTLNGGTINDAFGFPGILTLPTPGSAGSLSANKNIVVNPGTLAQSTLTVSSVSIKLSETSIVTLTIKDSSSSVVTSDGVSVTFGTTGGSSVGTFSTINHTAGTAVYTSTFTPTIRGTATNVTATITGLGTLTSLGLVAASPTITVINTAPTAFSTYPSNQVYPVIMGSPAPLTDPLTQGSTAVFSFAGSTDADGDTLTYNCTYITLGLNPSDPNYKNTATACNLLPSLVLTHLTLVTGTASFMGGVLTWTPTYTQRGTFQFSVWTSDGNGQFVRTIVRLQLHLIFSQALMLSLEPPCQDFQGLRLLQRVLQLNS